MLRDIIFVVCVAFCVCAIPVALVCLIGTFMKNGRKHRKAILAATFVMALVLEWGILQLMYLNPMIDYDEEQISSEEAAAIVEICKEKHSDERWSLFVSVGYSISLPQYGDAYGVRHTVFPNDIGANYERMDVVYFSEVQERLNEEK